MAFDLGLLHPQLQALLAAEATLIVRADTIADERAAYLDSSLRLGGPPEPVGGEERLTIGDVPVALYAPAAAPDADGLLVWLHGGGWYLGDIATFDLVGRSLANAAALKVLLVEYRLAPEHRWPAPIEDTDAVLRWVRSDAGAARLGIDPAHVVVGGDSAGGQLAVVSARHARGDGLPPLAGVLLLYPGLDARCDSESYRTLGDGPLVTRADMERFWDLYLDGADPDHPDASPLRADDHAGVPPTWVALAAFDPLRDDGLRYAAALQAAGVPVVVEVFDDMVHGFLRWAGAVDRTRELHAWLGAAARSAIR